MADKTMKAVIWAEVDPRGVQTGVAAANKSLESLNKTASRTATATSLSAAVSIAQAGYSMLQTVLSAVDRRVSELHDMASKYSGIAAGAAAQTKADQIVASVRIANAIAPGSVEMSQARSDVALGAAGRIERNAAGISAGMGSYERAKQNLTTGATILAEGAAMGVNAGEALLSGDFSGGIGKAASAASSTINELLTASNYAYPQSGGSARGMPYDQQQTELLREIASALKGGK